MDAIAGLGNWSERSKLALGALALALASVTAAALALANVTTGSGAMALGVASVALFVIGTLSIGTSETVRV